MGADDFLGLSGMHRLAKAMVVHWEHDPADHPALVDELETALGEALLEVGEAVMREHGLKPPTDPACPSVETPKPPQVSDSSSPTQEAL